MKHKTTEEHFLKYAALAKQAGVALKGGTIEKEFNLEAIYKKDKALNDSRLNQYIEGFYPVGRWMHPQVWPRSDAENTCMYKHLILYELLKLEPVFCEYVRDPVTEFLELQPIKETKV